MIQVRSFMMVFFALIIMLCDMCFRFLEETITFQFIFIIFVMLLVLSFELFQIVKRRIKFIMLTTLDTNKTATHQRLRRVHHTPRNRRPNAHENATTTSDMDTSGTDEHRPGSQNENADNSVRGVSGQVLGAQSAASGVFIFARTLL